MFRSKKKPPAPPKISLTSSSRGEVTVNDAAAKGVARSTKTGLAPAKRSTRDQLGTIGYDQARKAAEDAGRKPPSARTFRRWRQQDRIPDPAVADRVARRDEITRLGGPEQAAAKLGRSRSAVRDWESGRTHTMRADAQQRRADEAVTRRLDDSGINPTTSHPTITFSADVHARTGGGDYDFRSRKVFEFGPGGLDHTMMDRSTVRDLADAFARNDFDRVTAILEEHASVNFAAFDDYGDDDGFHFDAVRDLRIEW